jgi:hypothetical protein
MFSPQKKPLSFCSSQKRRNTSSCQLNGFSFSFCVCVLGLFKCRQHGEPLFAHKFHFIGSVRDIENTIEAVKPGVDQELCVEIDSFTKNSCMNVV